MKSFQIITLTLGTLLLLTQTSFAQDAEEKPVEENERPYKYTLQFDPLTAALGYMHLQLEHAVTPSFSYYVSPHARTHSSLINYTYEPYNSIGVEAGLRFFFKKQAPEGLWIGARGTIARLSTERQTTAEPGGYVSALGGYTWISKNGFVLSGGAGVQYINYNIAGMGPKGIFPALHTAFGTAF